MRFWHTQAFCTSQKIFPFLKLSFKLNASLQYNVVNPETAFSPGLYFVLDDFICWTNNVTLPVPIFHRYRKLNFTIIIALYGLLLQVCFRSQNYTVVIPFLLNFIQPIFLANSNFAPTSHKTQRRTPQTIIARTYVGNSGSKRLPDRSTDILLGVIYKETETNGRNTNIGHTTTNTCYSYSLIKFQCH